MSADLRIENILIQVKSQLQSDKIKLWLAPYYEDDGGGVCESAIEVSILCIDKKVNIAIKMCASLFSLCFV